MLLRSSGMSQDPRRLGGPVLYLDFDGVLHCEHVYSSRKNGIHFRPPLDELGSPHRLFQHAEILIGALDPFPTVQIVLSTSWAIGSFSRARRRLPEQLAKRCVGATYHSGMDRQAFWELSRGMQVWGDVYRRKPSAWLALDDDAFGWPAWCRDNLIRTDGLLGLGKASTQLEIIEKFSQHFGTKEN